MVVIAAASILVSCSGDTTPIPGGGKSSGSSTSSSGGGGGITDVVEGSWNVTKVGRDTTGSGSILTVSGDKVKGPIVDSEEGILIDGCTHTKDRLELDLAVDGNALTGKITTYSEWSGTNSCPTSDTPLVANVSGTRTNAGKGLDGEWTVNFADAPTFIVVVEGNVGRAWDKAAKARGREPSQVSTVAGGSATTTGRSNVAFAATKR